MKIPGRTVCSRSKQKGALIILTLLILLVVSILGMAAIDSTGLEMKMASNSRAQQQAFEAAEYTLSWVENDIAENGYFTLVNLQSASGCGTICFSSACTNGYCFSGTNADHWENCRPVQNTTVTAPYELASIWADASGKHKTLDIPNVDITTKYIIEFWCYGQPDSSIPKSATNSARLYRITAYAVGEGGRARAMLRSIIMEM